MWGKVVVFFALLLLFGDGLAVSAWLAPHACTQCPTVRFIGFGGITTATIVFVGEFGRITALGLVPIRTSLGIMEVLVAFVVAGSGLRNDRCVGLGTCY